MSDKKTRDQEQATGGRGKQRTKETTRTGGRGKQRGD